MNSHKSTLISFAWTIFLFACTSQNGTGTKMNSTEAAETGMATIPDSATGKTSVIMFKESNMRATGNEPFWLLELKPDSVHFKLMDGFEFRELLPAPVINTTDSLQYNFNTGPATVTVLVRKEECIDGMSGFKSPFTVSMKFIGPDNTQYYNGCGDYLSAFNKVRSKQILNGC